MSAAGEACKSYGAAALMRVPGRFRITWQDDNTLRIDSDAGMQTRLFRFALDARRSRWSGPGKDTSVGTVGRADRWQSRRRNMRAGYLRKNGVPYSESATLTEYFDVAPHPGGSQLLVVTAVVVDPQYLELPYIVRYQLQEGSGRLGMGSDALLHHMVGRAPDRGRCSSWRCSRQSTVLAQVELAGSWVPRAFEDVSNGGVPGRLHGAAVERRSAHPRIELLRGPARDDRAAVRGMAAVLPGRGPVRSEDLERHGTCERGRRVVDDRGVGRSRAARSSGWTGVRILPRMRSTRAAVSRPAGGKATRWSRAPRT